MDDNLSGSTAVRSDSTGLLMNIARGAKLVALLVFVLPWVTVSCAGQKLVTMTGLQLATGKISIKNPMTGEAQSQAGDPNYYLIAAAVLIVLALVATFVLARRSGALASIGASVLAAALMCYTILVSLPDGLKEKMKEGPGGGMGGGMGGMGGDMGAPSAPGAPPGEMDKQFTEQFEKMISIDVGIGFWLSLAALAVAVVLCVMVMQKSSAPAVTSPG